MRIWAAFTRAVIVSACMVCSNLAFGQVFLANDRALEELHERILNDPSNVELTVRYAQMARQRGDYEAAISAYERLLLYNPSLPQLKYELAALYFELESYAAARSYFEAAASSGDLADDLRANTKDYIAEIDRRLSPTRFRAYLHAGLRYQTNASAGPATDLIRFGGQSVSLDRSFAKQPDWNSYGQAVFNFEQDFGDRGDSFEASLGTYYSRQFRVDRVNLGVAELQAGPRFTLPSEHVLGASLKLYGIVNGYTLGDREYMRTFGAGASMRVKPTPAMVVESTFEYRDRKFFDSVNYLTASEQTGNLYTYALSGSGLVFGPVRWVTRVGYDWSRADLAFWSYDRPFVDVGMPIAFVVPWFGRNQTWVLTPYVGASLSNYDAPDPTVDPNVTRRDREWHVGATLDATLATNAGVRLNVHYARNDSNIANFAYRNFAVSMGPAVRF